MNGTAEHSASRDVFHTSAMTNTVKTRHRVGFVGERWPEVLETRRADFENAFLKNTGDALGIFPDKAEKITCDEEKGDTVVAFVVVHPREQRAGDIDKILRRAPYEDVWALYYAAIGTSASGPVTTFHRVGFIGNKWGDVVDKDWDRFSTAFITDTASALDVPPTDIRIVDYTVGDDIIVDIYVTHPGVDSEVEIDNKLDQYEYWRVWDLYAVGEDVVSSADMHDDPLAVMKQQPEGGVTPIASVGANYRSQPTMPPRKDYYQLNSSAPVSSSSAARGDVLPPLQVGSRSLNLSSIGARSRTQSNRSTVSQPQTHRERRLSSATRHSSRRVNLRELESELSRKQCNRAKQERQEQLNRSVERAGTLQRAKELTPHQTGSFLPPISSRNNNYVGDSRQGGDRRSPGAYSLQSNTSRTFPSSGTSNSNSDRFKPYRTPSRSPSQRRTPKRK